MDEFARAAQRRDLKRHFPRFSAKELEVFHKAHGEVIGVSGKKATPYGVVLCLALPNGRLGPELLNPVVVEHLQKLLAQPLS